MRALWNRIRDRLRRDALDAELVEELRFHQQLLERDAGDASPVRARQRLGNVTAVREETRDHWTLGALDRLLQDVHYALRGVRKSPGFAIAVIVTLALGVGANAAMFGIIDRLMFRPFAYLANPAGTGRVYLRFHDHGQVITKGESIEYTRYLDLKRHTTRFARMAAFSSQSLAVGLGQDAAEVPVAAVSGSFFGFFRAQPTLGRFFGTTEDALPHGTPVAVLGYDFWQSHFGGRNVLDSTLQVGDVLATIIGVAPRGFVGVSETAAPAVYLPITALASSLSFGVGSYYSTYYWGWVSVMAERKAGVNDAAAAADLSQAYRASWVAEAVQNSDLPGPDIAQPAALMGNLKAGAGPELAPKDRGALWVSGVALIVLLIACANVTNLFVVRALRRRRETAVRLALGVTRGRLLAQQITESLVLSGLAGLAGMGVAQLGSAAIRGFFGYDAGSLMLLGDTRALAVTGSIVLAIGVVMGVVPALFAETGDLALALRTGVRGGTHRRSRLSGALLVAQAALAMLLLVGAGLFVRSMSAVRSMRLGYDTDSVVVAAVNQRGAKISDSNSVALSHRLVEAAATLPGVSHAAWVASVPFYSSSWASIYVDGVDSVGKLGHFTYQAATSDYFATTGTRILHGRALMVQDQGTAPRVTVVGAGMAKLLWPGRDAIGQCLRIRTAQAPCTTVVGVAEDAVQQSLTATNDFQYYVPISQFGTNHGFALVLRTRTAPAGQLEAIRKALQRLMPGQYYVTTRTLASIVNDERAPWQFGATMFSVFGALALLVAAIGLYAVIAYGVAQRMHELGVRVALGAQRRDIVGLVMRQGVAFAVSGVVLGGVLAAVAARWVTPLLFHESARDPVIFGTVTVVLLAVAAVACALPAQRASRADPNSALRTD
jgi:putative ABC transport system permease protein